MAVQMSEQLHSQMINEHAATKAELAALKAEHASLKAAHAAVCVENVAFKAKPANPEVVAVATDVHLGGDRVDVPLEVAPPTEQFPVEAVPAE